MYTLGQNCYKEGKKGREKKKSKGRDRNGGMMRVEKKRQGGKECSRARDAVQ